MRRGSFTTISAAVFALVVVGMVGCGGPAPRAVVKGQVKLGEKNLTAGNVSFTSTKDKTQGSGPIDADGNYIIRDAPLGDVKISVTVPKAMAIPKMPAGMPMPGGGNMPEGQAGPGKFDPSKVVAIPDKYGNPDTSALTYTVSNGEQTHNINLTP